MATRRRTRKPILWKISLSLSLSLFLSISPSLSLSLSLYLYLSVFLFLFSSALPLSLFAPQDESSKDSHEERRQNSTSIAPERHQTSHQQKCVVEVIEHLTGGTVDQRVTVLTIEKMLKSSHCVPARSRVTCAQTFAFRKISGSRGEKRAHFPCCATGDHRDAADDQLNFTENLPDNRKPSLSWAAETPLASKLKTTRPSRSF